MEEQEIHKGIEVDANGAQLEVIMVQNSNSFGQDHNQPLDAEKRKRMPNGLIDTRFATKKAKDSTKGRHTVPHPFVFETEKRLARRRCTEERLVKPIVSLLEPIVHEDAHHHLEKAIAKNSTSRDRNCKKNCDPRALQTIQWRPTRGQSLRLEKASGVRYIGYMCKDCAAKLKESAKGHCIEAGENRQSDEAQKDMKSKKKRISYNFKALPLPIFYHQRDHKNTKEIENLEEHRHDFNKMKKGLKEGKKKGMRSSVEMQQQLETLVF